jgi:hypothetical protein
MYGAPGQVLHYRVIARTGDGLVFEGGDSTVVIGSATAATPTFSTGAPAVTPTTIDLPFSGSLTGTLDGIAVVYRRPAGQPDMQVADVKRVPSDGDPHIARERRQGDREAQAHQEGQEEAAREVLDQAQARRAAQRRRAEADEDAPLQVAGTSSS